MERMERIKHVPVREGTPQERREEFRETIFPKLVAARILESAVDDLRGAGFTEEEVTEVQTAFLTLSEERKKAVLSIPAELRPKLYERYAEEIEKGTQTPAGMIADILEKAERYRYTLGYHLSPKEIKRTPEGSWVIKGTEPDHRHSDIPMAYYSLDYRNRYRDKPSKFLYVVRAEQKDNSGHYQDNDGAWGHAPSLSIVDMINLNEIDAEMDAHMREKEKRETS